MSTFNIKNNDNIGDVAMSAADALAALSLVITTVYTSALEDVSNYCIFNVRQLGENNQVAQSH
jgi:hypothetical protein